MPHEPAPAFKIATRRAAAKFAQHVRAKVRFPGGDGLLWLAFVALSTATQLCFKRASQPLEHLDFGFAWLQAASSSPAFVVAVACYLATFALWIAILQRTSLSRAFLLTALVYVTVTLGSAVWLGESINRGQMAGIGLVITGIALLGRQSSKP